ncbi:HAD family hydrolase [Geothrix sp. 21YS21S-4]|uniref:HAD family hydrolase n=1 Tax=Geothrix sp. 21YS21S-4 TaxID=3068889 RepID=UPI0027B8F55E|nr:haloacid dehalogenase-like hydrolase [Geothrix sp. 21YS21S-4]
MPLCFDLDGTLGHFSSGFVLLREALGELWGHPPTAEELGRCGGSTDWEIVGELHRMRFDRDLEETAYAAYETACVGRFRAAFGPGGRQAVNYPGILEGMHRLAAWHPVWLVSGNAPDLLAFKADVLGIDPAIPRLGSVPRHDRAALLQRVLRDCPGPHLYVGDRPHDLAAAQAAGFPFLGVGDAVPGDHLSLPSDADADRVVEAVLAFMRPAETARA